jgi:hypothetical protein
MLCIIFYNIAPRFISPSNEHNKFSPSMLLIFDWDN